MERPSGQVCVPGVGVLKVPETKSRLAVCAPVPHHTTGGLLQASGTAVVGIPARPSCTLARHRATDRKGLVAINWFNAHERPSWQILELMYSNNFTDLRHRQVK